MPLSAERKRELRFFSYTAVVAVLEEYADSGVVIDDAFTGEEDEFVRESIKNVALHMRRIC